jgi:hypothetical protein
LAGRLDYHDGKSANFVLLCPECNRLMIGLKAATGPFPGDLRHIVIFDCELRHYSDEVRETWRKALKEGTVMREQAYLLPDLGPGLRSKLSMGLCFQCADLTPVKSSGAHVTVQYLDENKTEDIKAEEETDAERTKHDPR